MIIHIIIDITQNTPLIILVNTAHLITIDKSLKHYSSTDMNKVFSSQSTYWSIRTSIRKTGPYIVKLEQTPVKHGHLKVDRINGIIEE